jgi:hypothetical protein
MRFDPSAVTPSRVQRWAGSRDGVDTTTYEEDREMTELTPMEIDLCEGSRWDFSDLSAVYINCTLKRSPEVLQHQRARGSLDRGDEAAGRIGGRRARRRP